MSPKKVCENNWSRAILLNFLDTNLYEREGKAINNFENTLPDVGSDLANEITKDPYNFDFLTLHEGYDEKELKDELMDNLKCFLLELGKGFAFVGREYRLVIGETEQKRIVTASHPRLPSEYGRGFSVDNLENMRKFYLAYKNSISETVFRIFAFELCLSSLRIILRSLSQRLGSLSK